MKVARVIETFLPNITGPVNQAYKISLELEKRNINSPVFTTYYNVKNVPDEEFIDLVSVKRLPYARIMQYCISPGIKKALEESNTKKKIDIIHAHTYRSYQTEQGYQFAKKHKIPFVLSAHGSLLGYDKYLKNKLVKMPYLIYDSLKKKLPAINADAVIVNSQLEYDDAIKFGIDKKKIHVIPVGIDTLLYEKKNKDPNFVLKKNKNGISLLFVARISRNRNLELLIHALHFIKKKNLNKKCKLFVIGKEIVNSDTDKRGYVAELKQLAQKLGVSDMIQFVGEKTGKELIDLYLNADIFVYTSLYENFGQPLLEAAAAGLPIISPRIGIAREIIKDGETGYFVEYDAKDVSDKIALLFDKNEREIFGKRLQTIVKKKYAWSKIINEYCKLYRSLTKK
ncbi:glycosyltransferase family 4 protein [Candidatus Woesearchaeota archaeon]|nr:glycosyltransferase family 4 protein [Candidatus Woesearchaeota archaeon]